MKVDLSKNPYITRIKNDSGENTRVAILFIVFLSFYATLATFVLSNAA